LEYWVQVILVAEQKMENLRSMNLRNEQFLENVKMIEIKFSQGAKPGAGGILRKLSNRRNLPISGG
jgi:hypothetical protein